jgi:hypothetical protein
LTTFPDPSFLALTVSIWFCRLLPTQVGVYMSLSLLTMTSFNMPYLLPCFTLAPSLKHGVPRLKPSNYLVWRKEDGSEVDCIHKFI